MSVIHILSDGSRVEDITGRVVQVKDAETLYNLVASINRESQRKVTQKSRKTKAS